MGDKIRPDVPMRLRHLNRIQTGSFASVSYHSLHSGSLGMGYTGEIFEVDENVEEYIEFRFRDEEQERDIELTIGATTGDSTIRSRKNEQWTTLGTPLRIQVIEDVDSRSEFRADTMSEFHSGRHESVVAVAEVDWNEPILEWFDWSEEHA